MAVYIKHNNSLKPLEVRVDVGTTDDAIRVIQNLIDSKTIKVEDYSMAYLFFDVSHVPSSDPTKNEHYPLHFYGSKSDLYVNGMTAGFGGVGSTGTLKLLELMGFSYTAAQEQTITQTTFDADGNRVEKISLHFDK